RCPIEAQRDEIADTGIGQEILPLKKLALAAIDVPAYDRAAGRAADEAVIVAVDRKRECAAGDRGSAGICRGTLVSVPTIICAFRADIDLLPRDLPDIGNKEIAGGAIEAVAPRIAQSERPN